MFEQALLDRIRANIDIAQIVGEYVPLKKAGSHSLKGLCPFHQEKTPSFNVNTSLQIFKCFGCNESGNVLIFLTKIENISFPEAVRRLAERTGIPLPQANAPEEQERKRLQQLCETAAALYHQTLLKSPEAARARDYLARRQVSPEAIRRFQLGYSTGREIFSAKLHPTLLARAGLAGPSPDGTQHDRMRRRLILPIMDEMGRVIGFGGRALEDTHQPKYLNTPETALYKKSNSLYALSVAKDAIRKSGRAVLVEGYFDAIAAHAREVNNVVAILGTALTSAQLKLLKRFTRLLLIVYDEDVGGNEAAVRGLDLASEAGFAVKIVRLPGGTDPDEFLLHRGVPAFLKTLQDAAGGEAPADALQERGVAISLFDFRLEVASRHADPATMAGQSRIVAELLPFLAKVPNAIERFAYVKRLAERLGLRERDIDEELDKFRSQQPQRSSRATAAPQRPVQHNPTWRAERLILTGVLKHKPVAIKALLHLPPAAFGSAEAAKLAPHLRTLFEEGRAFSVASLMDKFQETPAILELLAAAETEGSIPNRDKVAGSGQTSATDQAYQEAAEQLERWHQRARLKAVQHEIERATDPEAVTQLLKEKQRLATAGPA